MSGGHQRRCFAGRGRAKATCQAKLSQRGLAKLQRTRGIGAVELGDQIA